MKKLFLILVMLMFVGCYEDEKVEDVNIFTEKWTETTWTSFYEEEHPEYYITHFDTIGFRADTVYWIVNRQDGWYRNGWKNKGDTLYYDFPYNGTRRISAIPIIEPNAQLKLDWFTENFDKIKFKVENY